MMVRRCPTLPHPPECSTIGAVGLSFRVRYGTGRFPHAVTAVTLVPTPARKKFRVWCGESMGYRKSFCGDTSCGSAKNKVVVSGPYSGRSVSCRHSRTRRGVGVCGLSCRPISTGQLHESLVLASTSRLSTQWSAGGLTPRCRGREFSS